MVKIFGFFGFLAESYFAIFTRAIMKGGLKMNRILQAHIKYLMSEISEKMCFADIWIDRISEGKVRWLKEDNEEIIDYLNDKYNCVFYCINNFNERYTDPNNPDLWLWAKSYLEFINGQLDDFQMKVFNSVWSLKALGD